MPFVDRGNRHAADRIAAGILLALSIFLLTISLGYGVYEGNRPGPGLYPAIISAALLVVSFAWLITGAGRTALATEPDLERPVAQPPTGQPAADGTTNDIADAAADDAAGDPLDEQVPIDASGVRRIAFVIGWALVPLLLLESVGYLISMTVYVGGLLIVIGRSRIWITLPATALGVLATAYGANVLGIVLPDPLGVIKLLGL